MKNSRIIIFILLITLVIVSPGCWDYVDVNNRSIVITIGIDKKDDNLEFATEIAKLVPQSEEAKTGNQQVYKDISFGTNFENTRVNYDSKRPYPTFLSATRVVIFGTEYAKEGIEPYMNRINQTYDYRKTLLTVVSKGEAAKLVKTPTKKDISVGFLIENMMRYLEKKGMSIYPTVGEILSNIAMGKTGYILPYIGLQQDSIQYLGFAIMKDSKLIDTIDVKESDGILYLLAKNPYFTEVISLGDSKYIFKVKIKERKIITDYKDGVPIINIDLNLYNELNYQYYTKPVTKEDMRVLEERLSETVKKYITDIIKKSQKELDCDILEFAKYFRADNPKIFKQLDWQEIYSDVEVNINIKSKIINMNLADPNAKKKY